MKITYTEVTDPSLAGTIIRHNEDGTDTYIPTDPANSDYQAYLANLETKPTK
jgi:hypothetical protein